MAVILEGAKSNDVCAFEDYESLESGLSREFIASDLLTPTSAGRPPRKRDCGKDASAWQLCRLTRPTKEEFRMCNEMTGRFMFAAKKVGTDFFISTYEQIDVALAATTTPTSPKANFAAVLAPHGGGKAPHGGGKLPLSYRVHLSRGKVHIDQTLSEQQPIIEVWPSSVWSQEQQVELRRLRARIPTPLVETPAHYIHDCASPTRQRPSHPGFFKSNDVESTVQLQNKLPKWNAQLGCLSLHFGRKRVKASSSKNFLIYTDDTLNDERRCESADEAVFQLGKLGSRTFSLDFRYPISPLQAFAIALTAFTAKHVPKKQR